MAEETVITSEAPAVEFAPSSFKATVDALSAADHEHWQLTGELPNEIDVSSASSPETASETPETEVENEAASEPAVEEQPKAGETPEQKSERKRRNDARRLRDFHKVEIELATEKTKRELLEKQIAESKTASAPVKEEVQSLTADDIEIPDLMDPKYEGAGGAQKYQSDLKVAIKKAILGQIDQRQSQSAANSEFKNAGERVDKILTSGRTKFKDFDAVALNPKIPASIPVIVELQSRGEDGHELMYHLGKNPELAKELALLTDIPGYKNDKELTAQALKDPQFALMLGEKRGIAKAEIARIAKTLTKPRTATPREIIARQGKPSGEVAVEANAGAVEDELADAVKRKDQDAYNRIMNKREMAGAGA